MFKKYVSEDFSKTFFISYLIINVEDILVISHFIICDGICLKLIDMWF